MVIIRGINHFFIRLPFFIRNVDIVQYKNKISVNIMYVAIT